MKFTKKEIETAEKIFNSYQNCNNPPRLFREYLHSLLKPERKFIDVRIEYQLNKFGSEVILYEHNILECLTGEGYWSSVIKVTELPEVFSRQDMIEFAKESIYAHRNPDYIDIDYLNYFLSERKSK